MTRARSAHGTTAVARVAGLLFLAVASTVAPARADVQSIEGVSTPIVRVNIQEGNVTVRTWDRPTVQIDADPSLQIIRRTVRQSGAPYSVPIPFVSQRSAQGVAELPAENFVATLPPGAYDTIIVRDTAATKPPGPTPVTITIPNDSAFVLARTGNGALDVRDYRSGTFVGFVGRGRMLLSNVGGTVFAQTARGPLIVSDSTFDRFRGRSLFGNVTFERCNVRQIETTTIFGSIVYDGGTFQPGLARFETERGDIAIGSEGPAQLGGHAAGDGRIYTSFAGTARVDGRGGDQNATVDGGGPVVTANTQDGNVFFYDGTLRSRQQLSPEWQAPLGALSRPGIAVRHEDAPYMAPPLLRQRVPDYRESPPQPRLHVNRTPKRTGYVTGRQRWTLRKR